MGDISDLGASFVKVPTTAFFHVPPVTVPTWVEMITQYTQTGGAQTPSLACMSWVTLERRRWNRGN